MLLFLPSFQIFSAFFPTSRFMMKNVMKLQNSFTDVDVYKKFDITVIFRTTFLNCAVLILLEGHRFESRPRKRNISGRQWTMNTSRSIGEDDDDVLWFWVEWSFTPAFFSPSPYFVLGLSSAKIDWWILRCVTDDNALRHFKTKTSFQDLWVTWKSEFWLYL